MKFLIRFALSFAWFFTIYYFIGSDRRPAYLVFMSTSLALVLALTHGINKKFINWLVPKVVTKLVKPKDRIG